MKRILATVAVLATLAPAAYGDEALRNPLTESPTWDDLKYDVLGDATTVQDDLIALDAPFRAHDAATVPVHITTTTPVRGLTLVIDENPAPVVAEFTFGDGMGALDLETRVRVNQYSNVRAIAEAGDGSLHMSGRFVRASGGCSAPAMKDAAAAMAAMGKMKLRQLDTLSAAVEGTDPTPAHSGNRRVAQIMIKHPNYSGLQRDQVTQLFITAHFIDTIEVYQGDEMLFSMEGGISISEDPSIRFTYTDNGAEKLRIRATDTDGAVFEQSFEKAPISM